MNTFLRIGLAVLFLDELLVGGWNAIAPESFYHSFPTVDLTPPFSEHYARDFGGATLGIALLLGIALVSPRTHFVVPAALAFSVFSIPHAVFHALHLHDVPPGDAVLLTAANFTVALLGVAVIVVAVLRDRRIASEEGAVPRPA